MATTKRCSSCNELKSTTQFSKYKKSKDGLQPHCKECQAERTKPFTNALLKADKDSVIYTITNPIGEVYVGKTNKKSKYRFADHRAAYNYQKLTEHSFTPKLHKSFDKWGIDAHLFTEVLNLGNTGKEELRNVETRMIIALKKNGKSLNINN